MPDTPYNGFTAVTSLVDTDVLLGMRGSGGINFPLSLLTLQGQTRDFPLGLTTAQARLHVAKAAASIARFTNTQTNGGDWEIKLGGNGFEDRKFMLTDKFAGADAVRFTADQNGNIGLGTTSPSEAVESYRSGSTFVIYKATNSNGSSKVGIRDTGEAFLEASSGRDIGFWLNGSKGAVLLSSGNFGVGVSSPVCKLDVRGGNGTVANFVGSGGAYQGYGVQNNYASGSAYGAIFFDAKNENGIPVANCLCDVNTDGSSAWSWSATVAGSRSSDRRTEKLRLTTGDLRAGGDNAQTLGTSGIRWSGGYIATAWVVTSDEREKLWIEIDEDRRAKDRRIALAILDELGWYQRLDAVELKGEDGARWHFGTRAQKVWAIVAAEGLAAPLVDSGTEQRPDPDWQGPPPPAWLCFDEWEEQRTAIFEERVIDTETVVIGEEDTGIFNAQGQPIIRAITETRDVMGMVDTGETRLTQEAGNRFGLRVDQIGLLLDWALHERDKEKTALIADLSARVAALEAAA